MTPPDAGISIRFRPLQDQTYRVDLQGSQGQDYIGEFALPYTSDTWPAILRALEPDFGQGPDDDDVRAALEPLGDLAGLPQTAGQALAQALFASQSVLTGFSVALDGAEADRRPLPVTLRFGRDCDPLAGLPWELLHHKGRFLVADSSIALSRCPAESRPPTPALAELPLRALLVLSEPLGASPIAPERQARELAHGLRSLTGEGAVVVDELRPPTYSTLVEAVRDGGYHVLHFYGHGVYHDGTGYLLFENDYGGPDLVPAKDVGAVLNTSDVRLVVMGACQSAMMEPSTGAGQADQWSSVAATLLRAGAPLVIGMQVSMLVRAAQAFTRQFYLSLAAGKDVPEALCNARLPLRRVTSSVSGMPTWFVPTLYGRLEGEPRLFDPDERISHQAQEEITGLRALQAEVERLEEDIGRLGVAQSPAELAQLRMAQNKLRQAQAEWRREVPGGYQPVTSPLYGVPSPTPHFAGRVEAIQEVARGLEGEQSVVIWGLAGIGKTTLAVEVVHRQRWRYPGGVLWLDCRNRPPFDSLLNRIGAFCGIAGIEQVEPDKKEALVRRTLAGLDGRCLLVWDNFEDVEDAPGIAEFLGRLPSGCQSLLTTRPRPQDDRPRKVQVGPLSNDEMFRVLLGRSESEGLRLLVRDLALLREMLAFLQGHPLALRWLVPLLADAPIGEVWTDLQAQGLEPVQAAFEVSYQALDEGLQRLFTRLSVFATPFKSAAAEAMGGDRRGLRELRRRALLDLDGDRYAYHALLRQYAYDRLKEAEDPRPVHRLAAEYLQAKGQDEGVTPEEGLEMVDQWERAEEWETFARRASDLVGSLDRMGYWAEIESRLERALGAAGENLDDAGLEAQLFNDRGILASKNGEWDRAIALWQECEKRFIMGRDEKGQAAAWLNLGIVYRQKGEWNYAIEMCQRSLKVFERLGDMHNVARTFNNLGLVYAERGEWDRAIDMYQQSIKIDSRLGDIHGMTQSRANLGSAYLYKGELDQAIQMFQQNLDTDERMRDVHGMAQDWGNLGNAYTRKGEWARAIQMYQQSLEAFEHLGDMHGMAETQINLGNVYYRQGERAQATQMYQRSLDIYQFLGSVHGIAKIQTNLGNVYADRGEQDQAIQMYRRSMENYQRLGDMHGVSQAQVGLGNIYQQKGEWNQATQAYLQSLEVFERLGDIHGMAQTQINLGNVYHHQGEWNRAIQMYQQSLENFERTGDIYSMAFAWGNLGLLYETQEDRIKAADCFIESYFIFDWINATHLAQQAISRLVRLLGSVEAVNAYLDQLQSNTGDG